jgi:hypothetical protein
MKVLNLGDVALVVTGDARIVGFEIGTGWYAVGDGNIPVVEAAVNPPLGVRGEVTLDEVFEALGV